MSRKEFLSPGQEWRRYMRTLKLFRNAAASLCAVGGAIFGWNIPDRNTDMMLIGIAVFVVGMVAQYRISILTLRERLRFPNAL